MTVLPLAVASAIAEGSIGALNDALQQLHGFDLRAFYTTSTADGEYRQRTLLHLASASAAVEVISALLAAGLDVNASAPDDGYAPLHCACERATSSRSARAIAALLRAGADREARCALGRTPCELLSIETASEAGPSETTSELSKPEFMADEFRMFRFKIDICPRLNEMHDWTSCPFRHPGEKARRRDPRDHRYQGVPCPDFRKGVCKRGDGCTFAHGVFECWLHPSRYRTQLCKEGAACRRPICFFAHAVDQLREPTMLFEEKNQPSSPLGPLSGGPATEESHDTSRSDSPAPAYSEESIQLNASTDSVRDILRCAQSFGVALSRESSSTCGNLIMDGGLAADGRPESLQRTLSHFSLTGDDMAHQMAHAAALQAVGATAAQHHAAHAAALGLARCSSSADGWQAALSQGPSVPGAAEAALAAAYAGTAGAGQLGHQLRLTAQHPALGHQGLSPLAQAMAPQFASAATGLDPCLLTQAAALRQHSQQLAAMQALDPTGVLLAATMQRQMSGPLAQASAPTAAAALGYQFAPYLM